MIKVKTRGLGVAPRKIRQVCDLIRMREVYQALRILRFCPKREIAVALTKLINSGLAVANSSEEYDIDNLIIGKIFVDEGPTVKRIRPRAQGRAFRIRKRTGHVTVCLEDL